MTNKNEGEREISPVPEWMKTNPDYLAKVEEEEAVRQAVELVEKQKEVRNYNVKEKLGEDRLSEAEHLSENVDATIKDHLLSDPKEADKSLDAWREFIVAMQARLSSSNLENGPEMVEKALRMAAAMMSPEADKKGEKAVEEGRKIIDRRYGK